MIWKMRLALAVAAAACYWTLGAALFLLLALSVGWLLPLRASRSLGQRLLYVAFAGFTTVLRVVGIIRLHFVGFHLWQPQLRGQILAPNHPALWDAILIMGKLPGLTCVLKASLLHNPLLVGGAKMGRFIPGSPPLEMVRQSIAAVAEGQNLLLFPESTRTRVAETQLNELRGAVGIISQHTGAPIWPVIVRSSSHYLSKGWPLWRLPEREINIVIELCSPLQPQPHEKAAELVQRLRQQMLTLLSAP